VLCFDDCPLVVAINPKNQNPSLFPSAIEMP
jgi:hypothetical protein